MDVKTRIRNIRILKIMNENLEASKRLGLVDVSKNYLPQNKKYLSHKGGRRKNKMNRIFFIKKYLVTIFILVSSMIISSMKISILPCYQENSKVKAATTTESINSDGLIITYETSVTTGISITISKSVTSGSGVSSGTSVSSESSVSSCGGIADTTETITISIPTSYSAVTSESATINNNNEQKFVTDYGAIVFGNDISAKREIVNKRFVKENGFGFAAEEANNLKDVFKGKNAKVVGYNNVTNGPDRLIKNINGNYTFIQDKYYRSAYESIDAAFNDGKYRYVVNNEIVDSQGQYIDDINMINKKYMQIEVRAYQYDKADEVMKSKISKGYPENVGVTDPNESKNMVRKGGLTYSQAKNIAKSGTVDSLKYDAANGIISTTYAFGIAVVSTFVIGKLNGLSNEEAAQNAFMSGVECGSVVFVASLLSSQLSRTGAVEVFTPISASICEKLTPGMKEAIVASAGKEGIAMSEATITEYATRIIRSNILMGAITLVILSGDDAYNLFTGRISKEQFVKNVICAIGAIGGGMVGAAAGGAVASIPGAALGGIAGGIVGEITISKIASKFFKDDADEMYEIIQSEFETLCSDYIISGDEGDKLVDEISEKLNEKTLMNMYQSSDRNAFAKKLMEPLF